MNEKLFAELLAAGMDRTAAETIAKGHPVQEPGVDVTALKGALDELTDLAKGQTADNGVTQDDLDAVVNKASDVVRGVTEACDLIVSEVRDNNAKLAKGMLAMGQELVTIRKELAGVRADQGNIAKGVTGLRAIGQEPAKPLSQVADDHGVIKTPGEQDAVVTREQVIAKAQSLFEPNKDKPSRINELRRAVALAVSGESPSVIAREFGLL